MNDRSLIHWGIPGMKWGVRRNNRSGNTTTVRSKPVQKNERSLSNKTRKVAFEKTDQLLKSVKALKYKELVKAREARSNKILLGLTVSLVASLGTLKVISLLSNRLPSLDSATDFSSFNTAYENWLANG